MNMNQLSITRGGKVLLLAGVATILLACTAGQPPAAAQPETAVAQPAAPAQPETSAATSQTKLNLNTATQEEFLTVPNVGNRMVREFFEYRPYVSIQQFRKEIGKYVDAAQVADYEKYVFVPIAPNEADEATLQQIPGVDAAISAQLVAARPFASNEAFIQKLAELAPTADQAVAQRYLIAP